MLRSDLLIELVGGFRFRCSTFIKDCEIDLQKALKSCFDRRVCSKLSSSSTVGFAS